MESNRYGGGRCERKKNVVQRQGTMNGRKCWGGHDKGDEVFGGYGEERRVV